jgi:hypothetical protein
MKALVKPDGLDKLDQELRDPGFYFIFIYLNLLYLIIKFKIQTLSFQQTQEK